VKLKVKKPAMAGMFCGEVTEEKNRKKTNFHELFGLRDPSAK
jgi:hypothetical protein